MATACSSFAVSGKKRKRVVLTIKEKLKICDLVKNGRSLTSIAAEFNVGKSTIHNMVKNKAKLQTFLMEIQDGDCIKKRQIVRRANLDALDKAVYLWFIQQRCKGTPISGLLLMGKALQLFPLVYPDDHDVVTQTVSHSQACQALETVLVYLEQQPEITLSTTVLLNSLLTQTARKRFQTLI